MDVKTWLRKISHEPKHIKNKRMELAELRTLRESITVQLKHDRVQSSKTGNRTEELTIQIIELEQIIQQEISELLNERVQAIRLIESLDDPEQMEILTLRYIQRKSWPEIMENTHASKTKVFRLHREALRKLGISWN